MRCAKDQAVVKNKEKTIDYIKKAYFHIKEFVKIYNNKEVLKHTSFLVDRLEDDSKQWLFWDDIKKQNEDFLEELKKDIFDFVRNDKEIRGIVEELNKA